MSLAELDTGQRRGVFQVADGTRTRVEPVAGQFVDQGLDPGPNRRSRSELRGIPPLPMGDAGAREGGDGVGSRGLREELHRVPGEVVIVGGERPVADVGDDVGAGRAAATATKRERLMGLDEPGLEEVVDVPSHGRATRAQEPGQRRGRDGAVLADRPQDPLAGAGFAHGSYVGAATGPTGPSQRINHTLMLGNCGGLVQRGPPAVSLPT